MSTPSSPKWNPKELTDRPRGPPSHHATTAFSHIGYMPPATLPHNFCKCFQPPSWVLRIGSIMLCACASRIPKPSRTLRNSIAAANSRHHIALPNLRPKPLAVYSYEPGIMESQPKDPDQSTTLPQPPESAQSTAETTPPHGPVKYTTTEPSASQPSNTTPAESVGSPVSVSSPSSPVSVSLPLVSDEEWDGSDDNSSDDYSENVSGHSSDEDLDDSLETLATSHFPPPYVIFVSTLLTMGAFVLALVCFYMILADIARILVVDPIRRIGGSGSV